MAGPFLQMPCFQFSELFAHKKVVPAQEGFRVKWPAGAYAPTFWVKPLDPNQFKLDMSPDQHGICFQFSELVAHKKVPSSSLLLSSLEMSDAKVYEPDKPASEPLQKIPPYLCPYLFEARTIFGSYQS